MNRLRFLMKKPLDGIENQHQAPDNGCWCREYELSFRFYKHWRKAFLISMTLNAIFVLVVICLTVYLAVL